MTTLQNAIDATRNHLLTGEREELNLLASGVSASNPPATIALTFSQAMGGITPGSSVSIDLEVFYVFSVSGSTATCIGGQQGTTPAAHAAGALTMVNSKFPAGRIASAVNDAITQLSSPANGLFQIKDVELVWNPVVWGYDLTDANTGLPVTNIIDIQSVRYKQANASQYEPGISSFRLDRNQTDALYPSGYTLSLYESAWPGLPIHVHYRAPFSPLVNLTDDLVTVAGLPSTATDIPAIGAAIRLMAGRELKRNFTESQDEPKRAQEIPPGSITNSTKLLQMLWQQRVSEECYRLEAAYPRLSKRR